MHGELRTQAAECGETQLHTIRELMLSAARRGAWLTLDEIAGLTEFGEASISAQLRHLRKLPHGQHRVEKRRRRAEQSAGDSRAWEYACCRRVLVLWQTRQSQRRAYCSTASATTTAHNCSRRRAMPKRVIDFDALWASDKIAVCPAWAQAEYAWLYGLADASGSFELTNLRVIWGRVAAVRKDLTLERLEQVFQEFVARGLLFTWEVNGKRYGHWTGSDVPGRLPPPSWRERLERLAPPLPRSEMAAYMSSFAARRAPEFGDSAAPTAERAHPANPVQPVQDQENGRAVHAAALRESSDARMPPSSPEILSSEDTQLKLNLEETQAQEWELDWKGKEKETERQECASPDRRRESRSAGRAERNGAVLPEDLLEIYEQERVALPGVLTLTPERRRQCAQRIRAGLGREEFRAAVRRAATTPFLAGQGARGWRASFDWLLANDTNVRKVNEGVYDAAENASPGSRAASREQTLFSELRVGAGPVASDYGVCVKPEALERIRARQAARRPP